MNRRTVLTAYLAWTAFALSAGPGIASCTHQQGAQVPGLALRVATDVCAEASKQPDDPAWVALVCTIEGDLAPAVTPSPDASSAPVQPLMLPRAQWARIKSADADGGP